MAGHTHRPLLSSPFCAAALAAAVTLVGASVSLRSALADPKPALPPSSKPAKPPLNGATHDYAYDGVDVGHPERAWRGRAFVHQSAAASQDTPLPIVVFIHGLNVESIEYRWMGGGNEGDVRRIVSDLIEGGSIPPVIVAAPSSVIPVATTNAVTSWPAFNLDRFLEITAERLRGVASIDPNRIIVAGHSGGGCNSKGGLTSALKGKQRALAALAIDTCMTPDVAAELAHAHPATNVIVSWQTVSWANRPIDDFKNVFLREARSSPAEPGVVRVLEYVVPKHPMPHDAMVAVTLRAWLPKLLSAPPPSLARLP